MTRDAIQTCWDRYTLAPRPLTWDTAGRLCGKVYRAAGPLGRLCGLIGRKNVPGDGLLLAPCSSIHTFGMHFPIDVVFLDAGLRILALRDHVPPWRFAWAPRTTRHVLELAPGTAQILRLQRGEQVRFAPWGEFLPHAKV